MFEQAKSLRAWFQQRPGLWLLTRFALACSALGAAMACLFLALTLFTKGFHRASAALEAIHPIVAYALWLTMGLALAFKLLTSAGHRYWPLQWGLTAMGSAIMAYGFWHVGLGWFAAWLVICFLGLPYSMQQHRAAAQ